MISGDFAYYRPETVAEAVELSARLAALGQRTVYCSGGTEIVTLARINKLDAQAVIDLKAIAECRQLELSDQTLTVGAAVPIAQVVEANPFPLFSASAGRVADHTSRCSITVGGNICGSFFYREAVLAFLVAESQAVIVGPSGWRAESLLTVFRKSLQLAPGEFLLQLITPVAAIGQPSYSAKKTRQGYIGYPLLSIAAQRHEQDLRIAVSGLLDFPFRSPALEEVLNDKRLDWEERISQSISRLPAPIVDDSEAGAGYREFIWRNVLNDLWDELGEAR